MYIQFTSTVPGVTSWFNHSSDLELIHRIDVYCGTNITANYQKIYFSPDNLFLGQSAHHIKLVNWFAMRVGGIVSIS